MVSAMDDTKVPIKITFNLKYSVILCIKTFEISGKLGGFSFVEIYLCQQ